MRKAIVALAVLVGIAAAGPAGASPRTPDGVPPGYEIPAQAGDQAFEFGNCLTRRHTTGAWMCLEEGAGNRRRKRLEEAQKGDRSRRRLSTVFLLRSRDVLLGDLRQRGSSCVRVALVATFWGLQRTPGSVLAIRGRSRRSHGSVRLPHREVQEHEQRVARQPTWYTYHSKGYDFYESYWFKLRDCAHTNPQTSDGTWYSVRYNSKVYHCVDSLGSCYFKGY